MFPELSGLHGHGTCDSSVRCQVCFCYRRGRDTEFTSPLQWRQFCLLLLLHTEKLLRDSLPCGLAGRGSGYAAEWVLGRLRKVCGGRRAVVPARRSAIAGNPWGGISWTGDGDTLLGKCLRSSHDPEAVHLHLNTYPSESGAAPYIERERVNGLIALRRPVV